MSEVDYNNMKIADLKKELKAKGLPVSGNKQDLIERLQTSGDLLDDNDDLLDQDDSMTDEAIKKAEEELKVPSKAPKINRDVPITPSETEDPVENGASKVVIESPKGKENAPLAVNTTEEKIVSPEKSKLTEAEVEEKIKARAERFGGFQSEDAKKVARAARFGEMVKKEGSTKIGGAPPADLDLLKKRAERFGTATSSVVKKAELSDAIRKRQERFGVITKDEPKPKKIALNSGTNSVVLDEKLKARQERFAMK